MAAIFRLQKYAKVSAIIFLTIIFALRINKQILNKYKYTPAISRQAF